jgi:hypothetical protein
MTANYSHWEFNGFDFSSVGVIVRTPVGPGQVPPLRGTDLPYAGIPGALAVPKVHDTRGVSLDLLLPTSRPEALGWPGIAQMMDILATLFGDTQLHNLTYYGSQDNMPRTAQAYVAQWLPADNDVSGILYLGTVTFSLPDPYFYGPAIDAIYNFPSALSLAVQNPGVAPARKVQMYWTDAADVTVQNSSNGVGFAITSGGTQTSITMDGVNWSAQVAGVQDMGAISHQGDTAFLRLDPGLNMLQIGADTYGGTVEIVFQPVYF